MPHFVIDCSKTVLEKQAPKDIMEAVFNEALDSGLFTPEAVKVRINPFEYYHSNNPSEDFIHVFASIMEGRTAEQKAMLSTKVNTKLVEMFPELEIISINIIDIEKVSYRNKQLL